MTNSDVCSAEHSRFLDLNLRKIFHNPEKILKPYISEGMDVLDVGCGPGFFTMEIVKLVEDSGFAVAADLQEEMLLKVKNKVKDTNFNDRISFLKVEKNKLNLSNDFDFILVFYMLHEVNDQKKFLLELKNHIKNNGKILISEPWGHVSKKDFQKSIELIEEIGFQIVDEPSIFLSKSIVIQNK